MDAKITVKETRHVNGQLETRTHWLGEKKHGLYEHWRDDGQLKTRANYDHGKEHGLYESWYADGQLFTRFN